MRKPVRLRLSIVVGLFTVLALLVPAAPAGAAPIQVTRFDDPVEDGCATNGCSLREAVQQANLDAAPDSIFLGAGTYLLTQSGVGDDAGDLDVTNDVTIQGAGSAQTVIDGAWAGVGDRIFDVVGAGVDLVLEGMTIQDGDVTPFGSGGGILVDTDTSLIGTDLVIRGNRAEFSAGIDNYGTVTLNRASFIENVADDGTGDGCCAGFYNESGATASLVDVAFIGNRAADDTGALYSQGDSLTITNALFAGNAAGAVRGGAVISAEGPLNLTNVTFSGNSISGNGDGGALATETGSTTTLNNVTITGNSVTGTGGGGGLYREDGIITVRNSIIAGNTDAGGVASDCGASSGTAFTSQGHNLVGSVTGCTFTGVAGDLTGMDPKLGPLADNGGSTSTHALLKGSPAVDAGGSDCASTDQRGLPRGPCDIGAYERVLCANVAVNRFGTEGNDVLTGTSGADGFLGFGGKDRIKGLGGNDAVCAGPGNDRVSGGGGRDRLLGEGGKDTLRGQGGRDRLNGGPARDICVGGGGRDRATRCEVEKGIP